MNGMKMQTIESVAKPSGESLTSAQDLQPWVETAVVGKSLPRVDAYERVSGSAVFALDVILPDMLYAAVLRCPHAHALVKKVATHAAEAMPGVRAVMSGADPEANVTLPYPWWIEGGPAMRLFDPHCRYAGEEVAAVAAETAQQAWDAVRAIRVEYQELPFVVDANEALKPGAPAVHEGGNLVRPVDVYERGDPAKGFAEADVVLEETYRTSCLLHTTMETHGSVAKWDGDRLTVWDSTQGVFDTQRDLARALGMPLSSVRVIGHYMGGGFGSKAELSKHTLIAVLLARKTARPVKLFLTREEAFLCVGNRPSNTMTLKAGVKKDGTLTAFQFHNVGAVGAYADWADVGTMVGGLYLCPNVRIEESDVFIHAGKARAMRAPGFPQCAWALEQMMDALAEKIGMDPLDLRLKNLVAFSQRRKVPFTSAGLKECLQDGAQAFGWKEARARARSEGHIHRGVGAAACLWGISPGPPSAAAVRLYADGSVNLNTGATDLGTGTKTILAMVVAEELGVPLHQIQIEHADTATTQLNRGSGGSQAVATNAPTVRAAAVQVKRQLLDLAGEELKRLPSELLLRDGKIVPVNEPEKAQPLSALKGLNERQVLVGFAQRQPDPAGKSVVSFAAQFAEVEVNTRTGEVKVARLVAAHDSGRVMNRLTYENQVFGGMTMGIGFGLTEQRVLDAKQTGKMVNANWHDYKIPTAKDVPYDQTCIPIDPHDTECNTVGAKGIGEPATIPTAAAIANAVYHATGGRVTQSPITPMQMLRLLAEKQKRR